MEHTAKSRDIVAVLAVGGAWLIGLSLELPWLNGPAYWQWGWRSLSVVNVLALFLGPFLLYGLLVWYWLRTPSMSAAAARLTVFGLALSQALLQWSSLQMEAAGWLDFIVRSPPITSYYTDAAKITDVSSFLRDYAWRHLEHHSSTHPPGPVLFYWVCIQLFGSERAAGIGGGLIGAIASLGVAVSYWFTELWTSDRQRRLAVSFTYALMPALVVWLPSFDLLYPLLTMSSLLFWSRSFTSARAAVGLGLSMFIATFMAYQCATLPVPLLLYALAVLRTQRWDPELRRSMMKSAAIALATWIGAYILFCALVPFHPLDSLAAALVSQQRSAMLLQRPYWACLVFDIYDFLLGSGFLTLPLLVLYFARGRVDSSERAITLAGVASILMIDLTGLIRCEASRVWLFLQPLVIVPAGLQLARYGAMARGLVLALWLMVLVCVKCKLVFMLSP